MRLKGGAVSSVRCGSGRHPGFGEHTEVVLAFDLDSHRTLEQVRAWLESFEPESWHPPPRPEARQFMVRVLVRFGYQKAGRADKSLIRRYLEAATAVSRSQVDRLIRQWREDGDLRDRRRPGRPFQRKYTDGDIDLLARTDRAHGPVPREPGGRSHAISVPWQH